MDDDIEVLKSDSFSPHEGGVESVRPSTSTQRPLEAVLSSPSFETSQKNLPSRTDVSSSSPRLHTSSDSTLFAKKYETRWQKCIRCFRGCCCLLLAFALSLLILYAFTVPLQYMPKASKVLALVCPFSSFLLFIAPISTIREALNRQDPEGIPVQVLVTQAACSLLSVDYGLKTENPAIVATNAVGLCLQLVWLSSHHYITKRNTKWMSFAFSISACVVMIFYGCSFIEHDAVGLLLCGLNMILFTSPILRVRQVLLTRKASSAGLSFPVTSMMLLANACWGVYGYLVSDAIIYIPSIIGYELTFFQLFIILWCQETLPFDLSFLLLCCPCKSDERHFTADDDSSKPRHHQHHANGQKRRMHFLPSSSSTSSHFSSFRRNLRPMMQSKRSDEQEMLKMSPALKLGRLFQNAKTSAHEKRPDV